jgi:hypothetical protein
MTIQRTTSSNLHETSANHASLPPASAVQRRPGTWAFMLTAAVLVAASVLPEASAKPLRHIAITHFAGDTVHATVWSEAGAGRAVQLPPGALVGFTWTSQACDAKHCETITYRITEVAQDTSTNTMLQHGDNSDVWLYRVEYELASAPDQRHAACGQDSPDSAMGIFVDGQWSEDGAWHPGGWTFSCLNGVIAKCVRSWGYKPWKTLRSPAHGDVDLQPLHQACTRAARADYCGSGTSYTRNGTLIDMFDVYGFNVRENAPGFQEESTFDEHGALSVSVPRWPTATPTETGWRFANCERPRQAARTASPLIHVWSDPNKGREIPRRNAHTHNIGAEHRALREEGRGR